MACCRLSVRAVQLDISLEAVHVNSVSAPWILDGASKIFNLIGFTSLIHQVARVEQVKPVRIKKG
ncbi:hypothetical protein GHT06_022220 [Daphnia sinensis]|uniref:Uncharacterized protein n=1 Tax=Daphnia sinensis TaxID=1820382 RepID=A0AAD5KGY4_9CRUS|nr:hypothetical protein GHT06_022220 [Daphnia sinensis]